MSRCPYHTGSHCTYILYSILIPYYIHVISILHSILECSLLLQLTDPLHYLLGNHANHWVCMINDMWAEEAIQQYWKGSCDPTLMFTALSSLNYDNLTVSVCLFVCLSLCVSLFASPKLWKAQQVSHVYDCSIRVCRSADVETAVVSLY